MTYWVHSGQRVGAYDDDVVIMAAGKSLSTISGLMQTALDKLATRPRGSKIDTGTRAGVYCEELRLNLSLRLDDNCSVLQEEVLTIMSAACEVRDRRSHDSGEYVIYTDRSCTCMPEVFRDCRKVLKSSGPNGIRLCWVPGHSDIAGNINADQLAKEGM